MATRYARRVDIARLLFPDFSLILVGWLVCRYTALGRSVWQQVETLVYYLLFPVLLFHSIVRSPLDLQAASSLIAAGVVMGLTSMALSYALPHVPGLARHIPRRDHAASAQIAFRFNTYIALALVERVAGPAGLQLVERNYRSRYGEIDLIMRDGRTLVFVEVRYRSRSRFGGAEESVDRRKQTRLVLTAASYLREHHLNCPTRFDVAALKPGSGGPELNWIKGAFQAD